MPGNNRIEPRSFIMSAMMFFILSAFLLLIPDQTMTLMTTRLGTVGPRECAAVAFVMGLVSLGVRLLVKNRPKQTLKREQLTKKS